MPIILPGGGGGSGVGALLFDSTLGANAASIDTGANGIAQTQNVLEVWIMGRTDDAAAVGTVNVIVNNDAGASYDLQQLAGVNATASAGNSLAQTSWGLNLHGAGGSASYPSTIALTIPGYAQTTFFKVGEVRNVTPDAAAANDQAILRTIGYRQTTAISRLKVTVAGGGTVLLAGTRLMIFGR